MIRVLQTNTFSEILLIRFYQLALVCLLSIAGSSVLSAQVSFTPPSAVCRSAGVQSNLTGGTPLGGVYSGAGVTDNGDGGSFTFDPGGDEVVVGENFINYTILEQLGMDIDGEASRDAFGRSVSLSADGTRVAIGAPFNDGIGSNAGHVRLYEYNGSSWIQLGDNIDGEVTGDDSGFSVSLSSDGNRVAIGAVNNDGNDASSGHVRLYEYDGTNWVQLGEDIDGRRFLDQSGFSVSLSSDGSRVAIGAPLNDENEFDSGHVRLYEYNGSNWIQLGGDIDGERSFDGFGASVALSSDGTRVAIGATGNDGNGTSSGHVRLYEYDVSSWVQLGGDINGETAGDESGISVSLSSDGTRVAIGAIGNDGNGTSSGHVRLYDYDGSNWVQLGGDIDGETAGDESGVSVSLSSDGNRVAIGARGNDGNGSGSGHVRLYGYDGTSWVQLGGDINGERIGDQSGRSVSLSSDGTRVAIGASFNDDGGLNAGHARIYNLEVAEAQLEVLEPLVTFIGPEDLDIEAGVQTGLIGGQPVGGIYSGPGVTDDGNGTSYSFEPALAGFGSQLHRARQI